MNANYEKAYNSLIWWIRNCHRFVDGKPKLAAAQIKYDSFQQLYRAIKVALGN